LVCFTKDWQNFCWGLLEIANRLELYYIEIYPKSQLEGYFIAQLYSWYQKMWLFAIFRAKLLFFSGSSISFYHSRSCWTVKGRKYQLESTVMCYGNPKQECRTRSSPAGKTAGKTLSQLCFQVNPGAQHAKQHVFNQKSSKDKTSSSRSATSYEGH